MRSSEDGIVGLLRFSKRSYLEELRNRGKLFLNTQKYFSKLEKDGFRADTYETADAMVQPNDMLRLTVSGKSRNIVLSPKDFAGPIRYSLGKSPPINIFCMYAVKPVNDQISIDPQNFKFGDSFVLILNPQEFLKKIVDEGLRLGHEVFHAPVEYVDVCNYSGDLGPFRKVNTFAYQNEYRVCIQNSHIHEMTLELGCLEDIVSPVIDIESIEEVLNYDHEYKK